jgi:N-acetylmuramoyl-L-alanine amidase
VYFFNHIQNKCVLIECGFLTNQDDLTKLKNEKYQQQLAQTICEVLIYKLLGE